MHVCTVSLHILHEENNFVEVKIILLNHQNNYVEYLITILQKVLTCY